MFAIVKFAWKILVGIKDALVMLLLILFFAGLAQLLSSRPNAAAVVDGPLILSIEGTISEQPAAVDPMSTLLSGTAPMREYSAPAIIAALEAAAQDDRVTALVLDLDRFLGAGQETLSEVGEAVDAVRAAGKPVHAYAAVYTNGSYQLASHADRIWMDPMGGTVIAPRGGSNLYFAEALERFGVTAHVYRAGQYKSAVEPFIADRQSPEAAEDARALYSALWDAWRAEVLRNRPNARIDDLVERPAELIEAADGDAARLALSLGLVDALATPDQFAAEVNGLGNEAAEPERAGEIAGTRYDDYRAHVPADMSGAPIAVIPVVGQIVDGEGGPGGAAGDTISALVHDAVEDDVPALVLRVDSPGGSVPASETIRRALLSARRADIPIVVSMANVAASGGYWISTPADYILAGPSTITGSIGVFGILPSFEGTLRQLGVNTDGVELAPLSGQPDMLGGVNSEFDRSAQAVVENVYARFLSLVSASRDMPVERIDEIAQGRVWAGLPARQIGLIDETGGLDDALAHAARLAELDEGAWHARYYEPEAGWLATILGQSGFEQEERPARDAFAVMRAQAVARQFSAIENVRLLMGAEATQALCLGCIEATVPGALPANRAEWTWLRQMRAFLP